MAPSSKLWTNLTTFVLLGTAIVHYSCAAQWSPSNSRGNKMLRSMPRNGLRFNELANEDIITGDTANPSLPSENSGTVEAIPNDVFISSPEINGKIFLFPWNQKDRKADYFHNEGYCKSNNAEMVSIQSAEENEFFYKWIKRIGNQYGKIHPGVWLSSIIENRSRNIVWLNGNPTEYQNWMPGEPNLGPFSCLSLGWVNRADWHDFVCTDKTFNVVCQRKSGVNNKMKLTLKYL